MSNMQGRLRLGEVTGLVLLVLGVAAGCGDDADADATTSERDAGADSGRESSRADGERAGAGKGGSGRADAGAGGAGRDAPDASPVESSEGDAETREITLRFKGKVGDADLECGRSYPGLGATSVTATPADFRFFVADVALITRDGKEVPLELAELAPTQNADGALLDFTDDRGKCGAGSTPVNTTIRGRAPAGEYTGLAFTNAVPEALNHQDIALAKPPFQDGSTYWSWAQGYRFILAAVTTEPAPDALDADGGSAESGTTLIHIGAAGCKGSNSAGFDCTRPYRNRVKLADFDPESSVVVADLAKLFAEVDLSTPVECHGAEPKCTSAYAALGLNAADGKALTSQQIFRVE